MKLIFHFGETVVMVLLKFIDDVIKLKPGLILPVIEERTSKIFYEKITVWRSPKPNGNRL